MKEKDLKVLSHFRNNARESLTKMSKKTKVPVSTIFDRLREYENSSLIKKHTSIIDFKALGFGVRTHLVLRSDRSKRDQLKDFLTKHNSVNNVFRISNGFDFFVEAIFKNLDELDIFNKLLENYKLEDRQEFFVMEDIKREDFLCHKENIHY